MHIPSVWIKESGDGRAPDGRAFPVSVWGWGDDQATARTGAKERLLRVLERIGRGEPFPDKYTYGSRPLREEILHTFGGATPDDSAAVLTRNRYGAQVLNTARVLFLDIDFPFQTFMQRIRRLFGGPDPQEEVLGRLRQALEQYGQATFRIYRTASGLRAMAVDRQYDATGSDAAKLMQATGTDPAYARLCLAQGSFRARLTPKPWRCHTRLPPGEYPRVDEGLQQRFASWLSAYEHASTGYATCRYIETIGGGSPQGDAQSLVELHDRITRCNEALPLA